MNFNLFLSIIQTDLSICNNFKTQLYQLIVILKYLLSILQIAKFNTIVQIDDIQHNADIQHDAIHHDAIQHDAIHHDDIHHDDIHHDGTQPKDIQFNDNQHNAGITVVEHSPHYPKVGGSIPATTTSIVTK
jgi:hypothetical protein